MAHHITPRLSETKTTMDGLGSKVFAISGIIGLVGLIVAVVFGMQTDDNMRHFSFSYLVNYAYFLSISLGAFTFIPLMFVTKASWNIVLRRLAEVTVAVMPVLALLAIPVIYFSGNIYGWAAPGAEHIHALEHKAGYLNTTAFTIRWVIYFAIWTGYSLFFWRSSVRQDTTGDVEITKKMEKLSGSAILIGALTIAAAAFDLVMSIDPLWFSTIFGIYYWCGGFVTFFAMLTLAIMGLQNSGRMEKIISPEHFHDLGKLMFAFTFFWGYVAFSQYMLYWYANIPEETSWFLRRSVNGWGIVGFVTLFATLLLPFAGLISYYAKRNRKMMAFWGFWIPIAQWINLYWVIMPEFNDSFIFSPMDVALFFGIGGIWFAAIVKLASQNSLVPTKDPRLEDSLRFENA
ncbi:MAG: quinol:cytochrome C oxidoreductase [bacterium]|nr:quinol:cytochrome C oxidoreductase [bacterium]